MSIEILARSKYINPSEKSGYDLLAKSAKIIKLKKYETIIFKNENLGFYIIKSGEVSINPSDIVKYNHHLKADDIFGFIDLPNQTVYAEATKPTILLYISMDDYAKYTKQYESSYNILIVAEALRNTEVFNEISTMDVLYLFPHLQQVELKTDDFLFHQNDEADSIYILTTGKLRSILQLSNGQTKNISLIRHGDLIGELGIISNNKRSLSIQATKNSTLLKLPVNIFSEVYKKDALIQIKLTAKLADYSLKNLSLIANPKKYELSAIVKLCKDDDWENLINKLSANNQDKIILYQQDSIHNNKQLNKILHSKESVDKNIIFILNDIDSFKYEDLWDELDKVYIVASSIDSINFDSLNKLKRCYHGKKDLVLIYSAEDEKHDIPTWLEIASIDMIHHLRNNNSKDVERLFRFMSSTAIGVVLSGGGARCWAEMGAIKALLENNIPIDAIGGTSAGAVVAACYALTLNYEDTKKAFNAIMSAIYPLFSYKNLTIPIISLINAKAGTDVLQKIFGNLKAEDLLLPFFSISCNLNTHSEVINRHGLLWRNLRSTIALPGIVPPLVEDGQLHVDGGLLDNNPVKAMKEMLGKGNFIISVNIGSTRSDRTKYNFPAKISFKDALKMRFARKKSNYKLINPVELIMRSLQVGAWNNEQINNKMADLLITPNVSKFNFLNMDTKIANDLIQIGYDETIKSLKETGLIKE